MSKTTTSPDLRAWESTDPRWQLVQRIASSQLLKSSSRLRDFLLYVGECAVREAPEDATEQQIGIHVFGRAPGYNSSEDSIVRTHARLLRQKLTEYFAGEGSKEQFVVEIPKGHYLPIFRTIEPLAPSPNLSGAGPVRDTKLASALPKASPPARKVVLWRVMALGLIALALLSLVAFELWRKRSLPVAQTNSAMETLWRPFLSGAPPLVIYSNALFDGSSKTGLRYAHSTTDPATANSYIDTYTGVGEVAAVYRLTRMFDADHAQFILKRSLLVTWDEASIKNLIFIGSSAENPSLRVLPDASDFTIVANDSLAGFVNHHPKPGEPAMYSRPEHPLTRDYAVLALVPGMQPGKWILICSGLTTFGTQAALEFATNPQDVDQLFRAAGFSKGTVRPFEALLETAITGGVPVQTKLVTVHPH